jgi:hypothetical protein
MKTIMRETKDNNNNITTIIQKKKKPSDNKIILFAPFILAFVNILILTFNASVIFVPPSEVRLSITL